MARPSHRQGFLVGRKAAGEEAICLIAVDGPVSADLLAKVAALEGVVQAKSLTF